MKDSGAGKCSRTDGDKNKGQGGHVSLLKGLPLANLGVV